MPERIPLTEKSSDRLDLKILPLTLCLYMVILGIIANWLANLVFPMSIGGSWGVLGLLLLLVAFRGVKWCFRIFTAANTNTNTTKPALAIVEDGPYRYSRNPMYVCYALGYAGLVLLMDSPVMLLVLAYFIYLMTTIIIEPEEAYLERTFGQKYLDYKQKVRRWI